MRRLPALLVLALAACPPAPKPDAGMVEDSGVADAGDEPDAGRPPRDAGTPDAGFARVPFEDWCALRAQALCFRDVRCGAVSGAAITECFSRRLSDCDQVSITSAVRGNRLQYLGMEAVACLNAYASGSCEDDAPACASVFQGLVPPDAGCILPGECNAQGFCYQYDDQCPHRCRPWAALGERCDGFTSRCDPASAACYAGDAGVEVCQPAKLENEPCTDYDSCREDLACVENKCTKRSANVGEPCGVRSGYPFCRGENFCRQGPPVGGVRPPGTCQVRSGVGGTCVGNISCLPSLRCSTVITTGTCQLKAALGQSCVAYDDCEDGLFCNGRSQKCERLPTDGGDCSSMGSFYRCATNFFCEFSATQEDTCLPRRATGEPCSYDGVCLSNDCSFGTLPDGGFGGQCVAPCALRADGGF